MGIKRIKISDSRVVITLLAILSLLLLTYYFHNTTIEKLPIVVVDNSHSELSLKVVDMINATRSVSVAYQATNTTEALQLIRQGNAYAIVVIPSDFEQKIVRAEQTKVALYNSGTNISTNGFISEGVSSAVTTFGAAIDLQRGKTLAQIAPTTVVSHILFNPTLDYTTYLAPCFMAMMIMIFTLSATVIQTTSKLNNSLIISILPTTATMSILALFMLFLLFIPLGIVMRGKLWLIILATLLLVAVYQAIALFIVAITRSRMLSLSLGGGYCVLAFTFSGLTFPTMAMSPIFSALSHIFPLTYYLRIFIDQAIRGANAATSAIDILALSLFLLLPLLVRKRL